MTRPSDHAQEWVVLHPVQPDVTEAPTAMRCDSLPVSITDTGALFTPPPTFDLLAAAAGERETITTVAPAGQSFEGFKFSNIVDISNRSCMPVAWRTEVLEIAEDETVELEWLAVGSESGSGAAMNMVERWFERWDDVDVALHHNPTLGGAGHTGHESDPDVPLRSYGGKVLLFEADENMQHACVQPVDFGGDPGPGGGNNVYSNHGGDDETHPLWWPHCRMYWRNDLHYQEDRHIHRRTFWQYYATPWTSTGNSDPLLAYLGAATALTGHTFDRAYIVNLTTAAITEIAGFGTLDPDDVQTWDLSKSRYIKDSVTVLGNPGPVPQGYVAIILHDEDKDMAVAFAAKLEDTDDDADTLTATQIRGPNFVSVQQHMDVGIADPESNIVSAVNFYSKSTTLRPAGWVGYQHFVITGRFEDMEGALGRLVLAGWLDDEVEEPPAEATAGTTFPTPPAAPALVEVPTLVGVGAGQMASGDSEFWRADLDADLGKASAADPLDADNPVSTLDPLKIIWNDSASRFEALDVFRNASGGSWGNCAPNTFGPQLTLAHAFKGRHDACWMLWMPYHASTINNVMAQQPGSWASGVLPLTFPLAVTVARVGDGTTATITADAGTPFASVSVGAYVQIADSDGWLEFAEGSATHPLRGFVDDVDLGGNNTHHGRPVRITAVGGGGASVTVTGEQPGTGIVYEFANETGTLTFDYGAMDLRTLAGDTIQSAIAHAIVKLRRNLLPKLTVSLNSERDMGRTDVQYAADLTSQIGWLRGELGVELVANDVPHCIPLLSPNNPTGTDEEVEAIRAAQLEVASTEDQVYTVETRKLKLRLESTTDWPEAARSDRGIHYTGASLNRLGVMIDEGYAIVEETPAFDDADTNGPTPSDGDDVPLMDPYPGDPDQFIEVDDGGSPVTFIVEDGTGLENAESYVEVDFATSFFAAYGVSAEWTAANTTARQDALRYCSTYVDLMWGPRMQGYQLRIGVQALEVPRQSAWKDDLSAIEGVPVDLKRAVCELVRRFLINPDDLLPDETAGSNVNSEGLTVGPLRFDSQFAGSATTSKRFPIVEKYMRKSGLVGAASFTSR